MQGFKNCATRVGKHYKQVLKCWGQGLKVLCWNSVALFPVHCPVRCNIFPFCSLQCFSFLYAKMFSFCKLHCFFPFVCCNLFFVLYALNLFPFVRWTFFPFCTQHRFSLLCATRFFFLLYAAMFSVKHARRSTVLVSRSQLWCVTCWVHHWSLHPMPCRLLPLLSLRWVGHG